MRSGAVCTVLLLAVLLLLYGGLNLAERGMIELLARDRPARAFTLERGAQGEFLLTFGGKTLCLDAGRFLDALRRRLDGQPPFP